ncbi:Zinc finger, RING-type [Corchorus olitorius]|uniref:RING-type E3 ubiquitin transferase n=1 Tax=Corchorus olitorius TaxID=93759 RepID=A0A1R3KYW4_9ROSI|nr:Zinc finger, RING-type [Corchorus olitorius]
MAAQTGSRKLMIVMSDCWFYKVQISYEVQQFRTDRDRFQVPVDFRFFKGFHGEEFRFEAQQSRLLNLLGWNLDDESKNSIRSALSALAISDPVQQIIVNTLFFADKQRMRVDIARQELRHGNYMVWDGTSELLFCPPLKGSVSDTTGQISLTTEQISLSHPTETWPAPEPAPMPRHLPATKSSDIDGLEKYKLVPMWRNEETNSITEVTDSNSTTECAICLQEFEVGAQVRRMPCKGNSWHIFHEHCIAKWLQTKRTCPLCRHRLPLIIRV